ncbi:MAG: hypothetical protein ACE5HW_06700 [Candidatus Methanofastidiosia archaeon]
MRWVGDIHRNGRSTWRMEKMKKSDIFDNLGKKEIKAEDLAEKI